MNSCYVHSFFVSFSVSIPFLLFIFFFSKTSTFFTTLFPTLSNICKERLTSFQYIRGMFLLVGYKSEIKRKTM